MNQTPNNLGKAVRRDDKPWYRQFWPWFIIAFPLSSVIASFALLWIALSNPDSVVPNEHENRFLDSKPKALPVSGAAVNTKTGKSGLAPKP